MNKVQILGGDSASVKVRILKDKCKYLQALGKPFTLIKSGSTYELQSSFFNDKAFRSGFTPSDLNFIKSVKQYVKKHNVALEFLDEDYKYSGIEYIKVNKFKAGDVIEDLYCIDVDGAYWKTALNLGIISSDIYKKGLDVGKVVRLAALGSLAKKKDIWKFDGKDFKKTDTVHSEYENLWFAICKKVSDVMNEVVKEIGDDFVFYWVDGIYVKQSEGIMDRIMAKFKSKGYSVHSDFIPKVTFDDNGFTVQGELLEDIKVFSYKMNNSGKSKTPVSDFIENHRLLRVGEKYIYGNKKI